MWSHFFLFFQRERRKPEYPQQQLQPEVPQFKVPSLPRGQNRRHAQTRLAPGSDGGGRPRDPSRWTYYSLADIDEDGGRGDMQIAADLMRELRRRQDKHQVAPHEKCVTYVLISSAYFRSIFADAVGFAP